MTTVIIFMDHVNSTFGLDILIQVLLSNMHCPIKTCQYYSRVRSVPFACTAQLVYASQFGVLLMFVTEPLACLQSAVCVALPTACRPQVHVCLTEKPRFLKRITFKVTLCRNCWFQIPHRLSEREWTVVE